MTSTELRSLSAEKAAQLPPMLHALWQEAQGHWDAAHEIAQEVETPEAAWVHAYLHRREGDIANAGYWYRRAGRPVARGTLEDEWEAMVDEFLAKSQG